MTRALEKLVNDGFDDFEWIIAGDGKMKEQLLDQISATKLSSRIRFTGIYSYDSDDLKNLFNQADIYVQPSVTASDGDKEGIPGTLIEAMAAGLPVISTHHAGIPEVVTEKAGMLVGEWDIAGLCEAICNLSRDKDKRIKMGEAARNHAITILDLHIKQAELEWIYDKLLKRSVIN